MRSLLFAVLLLATLPAQAGFFIDSQVGLKASPSTSVEYATRSMKFQTVGLEGGVRGGVRGWGMSLGLALTFSYNSTSSTYDGGTPATDTMTSQRVGLGVILGTDSKGAWNTWLGYYPVSGETYEGNSIRHLAPQDQSKGTAAELGIAYRWNPKLSLNLVGRANQFTKLKTQNSSIEQDFKYSPVDIIIGVSYPFEADGSMR